MPKPIKLLKKRGGVVRYRTMVRGGKRFTVAVTRKKGPRGGKTVVYPKEKPRKNPPFALKVESVQEQKARLLRELEMAKNREQREKMAERQRRPLVGSRGSIGQRDLFGGGDLLSNPMKRKHRKHRKRTVHQKARRNPHRKRRHVGHRVHHPRKSGSANYYAYRGQGGITLCRVSGSRLKKLGRFTAAGLKRYCQKHGIKM